ncbi:DUF6246 family protein [Pantoea sp. FN060301]|uniref:DUF6246 family protein n=1 Tax=Pantoea sp. FN060301 TaxID=3420380 RepID=UPI003D16EA26
MHTEDDYGLCATQLCSLQGKPYSGCPEVADAHGPELRISIASSCQEHALRASMNVMSACWDDDLASLAEALILGKSGRWTFIYRKGDVRLQSVTGLVRANVCWIRP